MTLELVRLKIIIFLLKCNIKIGRKLAFYRTKYSSRVPMNKNIQNQRMNQGQKFDMRGISNRIKNVMLHDQEIIDRRWAECEKCEFLSPKTSQCEKCNCFMKVKTRVATAACPIGKWDKEYKFMEGKAVNGSTSTTTV
tara:strand:+ start:287 stop:700 length:414 start_codon:yes stop_codon:yes gene_type:complete